MDTAQLGPIYARASQTTMFMVGCVDEKSSRLRLRDWTPSTRGVRFVNLWLRTDSGVQIERAASVSVP